MKLYGWRVDTVLKQDPGYELGSIEIEYDLCYEIESITAPGLEDYGDDYDDDGDEEPRRGFLEIVRKCLDDDSSCELEDIIERYYEPEEAYPELKDLVHKTEAEPHVFFCRIDNRGHTDVHVSSVYLGVPIYGNVVECIGKTDLSALVPKLGKPDVFCLRNRVIDNTQCESGAEEEE